MLVECECMCEDLCLCHVLCSYVAIYNKNAMAPSNDIRIDGLVNGKRQKRGPGEKKYLAMNTMRRLYVLYLYVPRLCVAFFCDASYSEKSDCTHTYTILWMEEMAFIVQVSGRVA